MPALPRLKIAALAELARELRYESSGAARRQLERAESLALEVLSEVSADPARVYPLDYVRYRITGLRTDEAGAGGPVVLVGEALLADLGALIERLSAAARTRTVAPAGGGAPRGRPVRAGGQPAEHVRWLTLDELCRRWGVTRKTVERQRRRGLLARRVAADDAGSTRGAAARERLVFNEGHVRAFETARRWPIAGEIREPRTRAARTARLTAKERAALIRRASGYRRRLGWTLNQCATRLAARSGRSREAVRRVLRRHDAGSDAPIFSERGPLQEHERALLDRGARAGASASDAARRLGKSRATVYRVTRKRRAERLRLLDLSGPVGPMFDRPDAAEVLLAPEAARAGLGGAGAALPRGVRALVEASDQMEPPAAATEGARAVAMWFLRYRARRAIRRLPRHDPAAGVLDRIETDLRWASRLKAELVRSQLAVLVRSVRARLGEAAPLSLPVRGPGGAGGLIAACISALGEAVEQFDPFRALESGARLAAPATIHVNRAITRWLQQAEAGAPASAARAAHRAEGGEIDDWTLSLDPWQSWLEPPAILVRAARGEAGDVGASGELAIVRLRGGFGPDAPPMTLPEAAARLGARAATIAANERRIIGLAVAGRSLRARPRRRK